MSNVETTDRTAADLSTAVDTHLAGYAESDRAKRVELLGSVWAPDGELIDPPFAGTGTAAIADLVDVVLQHFPAHHFERTTAVDTHHDYARYGWALVAGDGTVSVQGYDIVQVGADGKLARIVGFFGDLPPREA